MNLETLLEQEQKISGKISEALGKLRAWFEAKIEEARAVFETIKEKVAEKLRKVTGKGTLDKDIVKDGKKLASKGDSVSTVTGKIKAGLGEVKKQCNGVIKSCKDGIKAVANKSTEKAAEHKQDVLKGLKVTAGLVAGVGALVVGVTGASAYLDGKSVARSAGGDQGEAERLLQKRNDMRAAIRDDRKAKVKEKMDEMKHKAAYSKAGKFATEVAYRAKNGGKLEETEIMDQLLEEMAFLGEDVEYGYGYEEDLYLEDFDFEMEFDPDYL